LPGTASFLLVPGNSSAVATRQTETFKNLVYTVLALYQIDFYLIAQNVAAHYSCLPAANEAYSKLYVFQKTRGDKGVSGPFQ
ncbi:MAG: hypothetical protein ACI81P_001669, partial [Neolewinella sp.]